MTALEALTPSTSYGPAVHRPRAPRAGLWERVDSLVDRAASLADLRAHRLHLLAAHRMRALGVEVPADLLEDENRHAVLTLLAPAVLQRVREAYDGRLVVIKGPEAAAAYRDPVHRPFLDLDLLVDDAEAAQRALLAAGFEEVGVPERYVGIHHLRPLAWQGIPLPVELHSRPKWIDGLSPPSTEELLAAAVPGTTGVPGLLALPPAHHALVLTAHSWAHEPLRRLIELIDIEAVAAVAAPGEIDSLASRWGLERVWRSTSRVADSLAPGRRRPLSLAIWARNIRSVRERTVLEAHLEGWLAPFWALPFRAGLRASASAVIGDVRPRPGENWSAKLNRTRLAVRNRSSRRSEHQEELAGRQE